MADYLPEDLIVRILERLQIKSLIRFTCVSKRWRSIILADPEFAKTQFQIASQHQTLRHRLLFSTACESEFNSLDLDAPSPLGYNSSVRCPFTQPGGRYVIPLCSCNGLILATLHKEEHIYIWNPSTQFFKKLPDPADRPSKTRLFGCGFGYLSATDDYRVVADFRVSSVDEVKGKEMHIFSSRANIWKRTEAPLFDYKFEYEGTLSNEALHWLDELGIFAFDLAKEEFQRMPLPILDGEVKHLGAFGDCLCAFDCAEFYTAGSIDLWVMKKYGVADSWTKLFNLEVSDQPQNIMYFLPLSVMETSTVMHTATILGKQKFLNLIRIGHTKQKPGMHLLSRNTYLMEMIAYEETLLGLLPLK
ncbi:putative F-box domain-containing protein [Rosa chinensis]|uniref:Putative F-box domain-containing protein n=1 Tax=Rosa chinensis TaxID=74649 RepID=A0A2P6RMB8_ROSCH|nr:F-box protein CPR1 [Rosa chinensis]PRQ47565.1 putative F-box domain-containing protein [Rosa chinensis]